MFKKLKAHDFSNSHYFSLKTVFLFAKPSHFSVRYPFGVAMATVMYRGEWNIDSLVLGRNIEDRKVLAKSVTMRATEICSYREWLLSSVGGIMTLSVITVWLFPDLYLCKSLLLAFTTNGMTSIFPSLTFLS